MNKLDKNKTLDSAVGIHILKKHKWAIYWNNDKFLEHAWSAIFVNMTPFNLPPNQVISSSLPCYSWGTDEERETEKACVTSPQSYC